jgi:UDP-N-acetylmuramoyl-tripeptide--D-alanyl-D-alanine ligase
MAAALSQSGSVAASVPAPFAMQAAQAERMTGGRWIGPRQDVVLRGAVIDSRLVRAHSLFVCLAGERVDGHDFAEQAARSGAALILASRELPGLAATPVLVVADVVRSLAIFATSFRRLLSTTHWIGVTGSSGKTTVKELISAAISRVGSTYATAGNLNNHLGVPMSVLAVPEGTQYAVIEMGANHQHEISALSAIVQPMLGVISCLGPAHLEGFGGIEGVARAKSELFAALPVGATAILGISGLDMVAARLGTTPARMLAPVREAAAGRRLLLVGSPECPVDGEVDDSGLTLRTPLGSARLPLLGGHNLANAAIAYQAARALGIEPGAALEGLEQVRSVPGRLCLRLAGRHRILDDSYNANPGSMIAGLQVLSASRGRHLAVLGAMGELGMDAERGHRLVGIEAARLGLPVIVVGPQAQPLADAYVQAGGVSCQRADTAEEATRMALADLKNGPCSVLVKASRSSALDRVVTALISAIEKDPAC